MLRPACETRAPRTPTKARAVLELTVNNHPGVMSHVCGLLSRRAYNVEGILCLPIGDGAPNAPERVIRIGSKSTRRSASTR